MYNCVLFDLDGTLLDTSQGVTSAIKQIVIEEGLPPIPQKLLHTFIGPPIEESLQAYYNFSPEKTAYLAGVFRQYYAQDEYLFQAEMYPEAIHLLKKLKLAGVKIAVATNKRHYYTVRILEYFGIAPYCDIICGSDECNNTKTKVVRACLRALHVEKHQSCVLVGDTIVDAKGAFENGIDFIGVTYGFGLKANDPAPVGSVTIIDNLTTLEQFLIKEGEHETD